MGHLRAIFEDLPVLITVNNAPLYAYTAGKAFRPELPTVVLIHGALHDHSVWGLQSRYLANHQFNVLAIDLPGHCKSGGPAPTSVEQAAASVVGLLDALDIGQATLIGHSLGSLIALEVAAQNPQRVSHLVLAGTAFPMRVSPGLLDAAQNAQMQGIDMVNTFSLSMMGPPPSLLGPGTWLHGLSSASPVRRAAPWPASPRSRTARGHRGGIRRAGAGRCGLRHPAPRRSRWG
jgi:pimeloyl-ACP methyl ester carboxylesterase